MVFFTVSKNINIKIADSTLIKFHKIEDKNNLNLENVYLTTYDDIASIKDIFLKVSDEYKLIVEDEKKFSSLKALPRELGIENKNEFNILTYDKHSNLNEEFMDISTQIKTNKKDIKLAIIGGVGKDIGEKICGASAIRILKQELEKSFRSVIIDVSIQSSDNKFYIRDKEILKNSLGVNRVIPLPINIQTFCKYDFYIDTSSIEKTYYYEHLSYIDAYLYKFGIDYTKISSDKKFNKLKYNRIYKPSRELKESINSLKTHGKTLLFHPFSPDPERSMPRDIAIKMINKLIKLMPEYTIVSALKIDGIKDNLKQKDISYKDDRFEDLSTYSKSFFDFAYIISNMDKIITVDTSTYHIADIYFIPTVVIFHDKNLIEKRLKYYHTIEPYLMDKKSEKSFSSLKFETPELILNKLYSWKEIKVKKIIKLFNK